jgi:hypothetical protein
MSSGSKWTPDIIQRLMNLKSNGMSIPEIANELGRSKWAVEVQVLKINSRKYEYMERLTKVNEALKYAVGIPQNKWDYGKYREMYENNLKEAQKRLEDHKTKTFEMENKLRLRGVDETEIQKNVYSHFSQMHIQLLEQVLAAKKALAMMDVGTVEELTRQKIVILEEMVLETTTS